jgi:hypothetical protein
MKWGRGWKPEFSPSSASTELLRHSLSKAGVTRAFIVESSLTLEIFVPRSEKKKALKIMTKIMPRGIYWEVSGTLPWWRCRLRRIRVRYG